MFLIIYFLHLECHRNVAWAAGMEQDRLTWTWLTLDSKQESAGQKMVCRSRVTLMTQAQVVWNKDHGASVGLPTLWGSMHLGRPCQGYRQGHIMYLILGKKANYNCGSWTQEEIILPLLAHCDSCIPALGFSELEEDDSRPVFLTSK